MATYLDILKQYWGYDSFRPLQDEIVESIGAGKDTLGLMPTGGGKSITFQVPAMAKEGLCLVITPLIALMKDQVRNLKKRGIKAAAIYAGMTLKEASITYDNCTFGDYKFLYLSPERVGTRAFLERLPNLKISMLAIDEAHCISQWGYDFRPSYLKIAELREKLPGVPVLAVTATATPAVVKDIQEKLHFPKPNLFKKSFNRDNLIYALRYTEDKSRLLLKMLRSIKGTAIVYTRNRKRTKELADLLLANDISADFFHAGIPIDKKDEKQKAWTDGSTRVIVATNAFGMGIDKPDVRLVVHFDLPDSLEAYFQEAGRAGRDGKKAYAVQLFAKSDAAKIKKRVADSYPKKDFVRAVYDKTGDYLKVAVGVGQDSVFEFNLGDFCAKFKLPILPTHSALKILERAGYLVLSEERDNASRLMYYDRHALLDYAAYDDREAIVKATLRRYTGLFSDYAYVNEGVIARKSNTTREQVYEVLKELSKRKLGHYVPQNSTPLLTYVQNRYDSGRLHLGREAYEDLFDRYTKRIESMLHYAATRHQCRNQMLLAYFGEKIDPCGQCDVCVERAKSGLSKADCKIIADVIADKLRAKPLRLEKLVDMLPYPESDVVESIRTMLDDEVIGYNGMQELSLLS